MKRKFRASHKIKIFFFLFVISLFSFSIISFDAVFAISDNLPSQSRAPNSDNSNGKLQIVGVTGKIPGQNINVYILVLVPPGTDKNEVAAEALANRGAIPFVTGEKFSTTGVEWDQFGDNSLSNDYLTQNYNPANDPSSGAGLSALLNSQSKWNNVPYSNFAFDYGGLTTRCPSLEPKCNFIPLSFRDGFNDVAWMSLDEQRVLGVTYSVESNSAYPEESDIIMNTNLDPELSLSWEVGGIGKFDIDIETVFLHENGHVLGLGHQDKPTVAVMNPIYQGILQDLLIDDITGVSSLYPCAGCPAPQFFVVYEDDMENGINGWTETGDTELWHQSTNTANSPNTSWYYGQEGVFNYDTGAANSGYLTSPLISLDGVTQAFLEFAEWSEVENQKNFDHTRVQASNDGTNWTTVHFYKDAFLQWENHQVNLEDFAGGDLYVRFWFDTVDELENQFEGWYVDDVKILVDNTADPTCIGDQTVVDGVCTDPTCIGDQTVVDGVCTDPTCIGDQVVVDGFCVDPDPNSSATITITNPPPGEISGKITISAILEGFESTVDEVFFGIYKIVDGVVESDPSYFDSDSDSPYSMSIHTKDMESGFYYDIIASAMDSNNEINSDPVRVYLPAKGQGGSSGGGPDCTAKPNHPKCPP